MALSLKLTLTLSMGTFRQESEKNTIRVCLILGAVIKHCSYKLCHCFIIITNRVPTLFEEKNSRSFPVQFQNFPGVSVIVLNRIPNTFGPQ